MINPEQYNYYTTESVSVDRAKTLLAALLGELDKLSLYEQDPDDGMTDPVNPEDFEAVTLVELESLLRDIRIGVAPEVVSDDDDDEPQDGYNGPMKVVKPPAPVDDETCDKEND